MTGDSAGQTWSGRSLSGTGYDGDSGAADPAVLAALADRDDERALMEVLASARLLVPIVAAPAETETNDAGQVVEKSTDMAVVTLTAPDGQRALPVFTGTEALTAWDPAARPSPVAAAQAAQAAVAEQCDVMVLDLGTDHTRALRPSMVWALAQQRPWMPAHEDPFVQLALSRAVDDESAVDSVACEAGGAAGELRVVLAVRPGLEQGELQQLAQRIGERIATDGEARARIDAIAFAISRS